MKQRLMANDHSSGIRISRIATITGILAAIVSAMPCFFSHSESLRLAIAGANDSSIGFDRLCAWGFAMGGLSGADWIRAAYITLPLLAVFVCVPRLAKKLPLHIQPLICGMLLVTALAMIGLAGVQTIRLRNIDVSDIRLLGPVDLLKAVNNDPGRIFFNVPALSAARLLAPDISPRAPDALTSKNLASSPVKWREEDRRNPFNAVLLSTPLEDSRPLVEMLLLTPGWQLARIDNQGLLFLRGINATIPEEPVFQNPRDAALFAAQKAMIMHFLGETKAAREMMNAARASAPNDPLVLVQSATLAASLKQWPKVRKDAESALEADSASVQARYLRALALLETGNIESAAWDISSLCSAHPEEPSVLWLAARIARESNDPTSEIAALDQLLILAKKNHEEPTVIHIHLAQAWAKRGFAAQALENYNSALDGTLTPDQRKELEAIKALIQSRSLHR